MHPPTRTPSVFRLLTIALLCCTQQLGCALRRPPAVFQPPPKASAVERAAGGSLIAVSRPTPGAARLSIWIAAGSRDAKVPQLATAAAWWAADQAQAEARVLPDGTALSLSCSTREQPLEACAERLLRVLNSR